ncbi:MAG: tetratricopeptide repeat protein [Bacteroidia bacterium]|nr:tetratricopeptide repeat protein [Bacteroidia bacterium]MDW8301572.1 tetratricopeptide repeat protein [Bacteroidia bacterium]
MHALLFLFFVLCGASAVCQNEIQKAQLAKQYLDNQEFDKAEQLYKELMETNKQEESYVMYYNTCLVAQKKYVESEKLLTKKAKKNPLYALELGYTYYEWGKMTDAERTWMPLLKPKSVNKDYFVTVGMFFSQKNLPYWQIRTYQEARNYFKDDYLFSEELIELYGETKNITQAVAEFVRLLKKKPNELQMVQTKVTNIINSEEDFKKAEQGILQEIAQDENNTVMKELLIWLYLQHKDYENALIQAKALDRLNKERGYRIVDIAEVAEQNKNYPVAIEAYNYVIQRYPNDVYHEKASMGKARVSELQATEKTTIDKNEIQTVIQNYKNHIQQFGKNQKTVDAMYRIAYLSVFYLYDLDQANKYIEEILSNSAAAFKRVDALLLKADICIIKGDFDTAENIYIEIQQQNKDAVQANLAKFKHAQLSYYKGEFALANSRLKILKQGTHNDIANDALKLSLFIQDNTIMDSNTTVLRHYARAELLDYQNKKEQALLCLDSLIQKYPTHPVIDDAWFLKAKIYTSLQKIDKALSCYQEIMEKYSNDILADDAMYLTAKIYDEFYQEKDKALALYQDFLARYPGSLYITQVRKRIRELRGEKVN